MKSGSARSFSEATTLSKLRFLSWIYCVDLKGIIMPDQLTVPEFVDITHEDYKAPTTSVFCTRMAHCRNTVAALEEVKHSQQYKYSTIID